VQYTSDFDNYLSQMVVPAGKPDSIEGPHIYSVRGLWSAGSEGPKRHNPLCDGPISRKRLASPILCMQVKNWPSTR
jgi:hypothetical protein